MNNGATFISDDLVLFCFVIIKSSVSSKQFLYIRFWIVFCELSEPMSAILWKTWGIIEFIVWNTPFLIYPNYEIYAKGIFLVEDPCNIRAVSPQTGFQALDCFLWVIRADVNYPVEDLGNYWVWILDISVVHMIHEK